MRVATFTDTSLLLTNGHVVHVMALLKYLDTNHQNMVFCPKPKPGQSVDLSLDNTQVTPVSSVPALLYPEYRMSIPTPKSMVKLKRFKPDIIHVHSFGPLGLEGIMAAKILGIPVVGTFHTYFMDPEYLKIVKLARFKRLSKALWRLTISFYNKCDVVLAPSQSVVDDLTSHGLESKTEVVPSSIDISVIKREPQKVSPVCKRYKLGKHVVLYVGRLSKEKNLTTLIDAFAQVYKKLPKAQLVIIGGGPFEKKLHDYVKEKGLKEAVVFLSEIPHQELLSSGILHACQLFCTASTTETFGVSILEAMAAGLPVVGFAARGLVDLVKGNGVLVNPGETKDFSKAMSDLLSDPKKRESFAKVSKKRAKLFSIEETGRIVEGVYEGVV